MIAAASGGVSGAAGDAGKGLSRAPGNVKRVVEGSLKCVFGLSCGKDVRVGRWMSEEELEKMIETCFVQPPHNGSDQSHVTVPAIPDYFQKQAPKGSVFVTFKVPKNTVFKSSEPAHFISVGPNSVRSKIDVSKGLPAHTPPRARNIYIWTWP